MAHWLPILAITWMVSGLVLAILLLREDPFRRWKDVLLALLIGLSVGFLWIPVEIVMWIIGRRLS